MYLSPGGAFRGSGRGQLTIVKSPAAARVTVPYAISAAGVTEPA